MEIPNIPTDNLYKFMALSGVIIVLFFISVFILRLAQINENLSKENIEIEELIFERLLLQEKDSVLMIEIKDLRDAYDKYKFNSKDTIIVLDDLIKSLKDPEHREYLKFFYTYQSEIIPEQKLLNDLNQRIKLREENRNLLRIKGNLITIKNSQIKSDIKSLRRFIWLMAIGCFSGYYLASRGFRLWYNRVQKYLDKKLEKEAQPDN